jgi:hypothetical protein
LTPPITDVLQWIALCPQFLFLFPVMVVRYLQRLLVGQIFIEAVLDCARIHGSTALTTASVSLTRLNLVKFKSPVNMPIITILI